MALGISVMGFKASENIWIYLVANLAGGAVAAIVFKTVNSDGK